MLSTGRWAQCYRYLHPSFPLFSVLPLITSFLLHVYWSIHYAGNDHLLQSMKKSTCLQNPPQTHSLSVTHTHTRTHTHFYTLTHTQSEGEHQQLVFSLCFFTRAALILLDKGWESQENIIAHTHTHTVKCATPLSIYTQTCAGKYTSVMDNTHSNTSLLVAFYLNCLCHCFHCSLVQLANSFLGQHITGLCNHSIQKNGCVLWPYRTEGEIRT